MTDHPYAAEQFDAYAALGYVLGATTHVTGVVTVTNLPCRPAPMLARTVTAVTDFGAGGFVFSPVADTLEDAERARARWAREIVPAVRAAID